MKRVPVILYGAGGVGCALLRQIVNGRERMAARNHCHFKVVAVTDSKTWQWAASGLTDERLLDIAAARQQGLAVDPQWRETAPLEMQRPSDHGVLDAASEAELEKVLVVDVTAADGMESVLKHSINLGYSVVLANKKPLAAPWERALGFFNHSRVRHESTVGGGQPIIATLRYLLDTNDPIYQVEGQMSGTLGYICQRLDEGVAFSTAVWEAKNNGYTEPDPRDDLGGMDVMRKLLILGRLSGWPLEESDITVESLYSPDMASLSVSEFMDVIAQLDGPMQARVSAAKANGQVLRYVAEVNEKGGSVGLKAMPSASALANLKYISFRTERYDDEPLLIGGKGAGVEMTAAGVMGDMLALVREVY
ncbi:MAG TPA: homoserine dehydrogenase [Chloroflexota bacterium]|nr:homoserine dehydrogenase [Chloroflexota bacterium]HUM68272.1 homoserine dehydrogenase [Chloroflexota bacterium]